jgi:hypothetical protein
MIKMPKKKIKKNIVTIRFNALETVLKESFDDFKKRIEGMPMILLMSEFQSVCAAYGELDLTEKGAWTDKSENVFNKICALKQAVMYKYHLANDLLELSEYHADETYRLMEKKEKNVKVFKKSNKQSK